MNRKTEFCVVHNLEFIREDNRETLYQCSNCPYFEFQYEDTIGG